MSQICGHCDEWATPYPGADRGICLAIGRALPGARAEMGYFDDADDCSGFKTIFNPPPDTQPSGEIE